jgi:hypothetical protein
LSYCPECGQREIDPDPTLKEFLHELGEEVLHWDGKLGRTIRTLLTKPGELTREYLAGRRVRYVSPIRLYLTFSVLYFALNALLPPRMVVGRDGQRVEEGIIQISTSTPRELAVMEADAQKSTGVRRIWLSHMALALAHPTDVQHATTASIPKGMFVLVPFFAALVGLVYRDRRRKYPQHLAFALHVHAVLFIGLTLGLVGTFMPTWARVPFQVALLLALAVYAVRAAATVYESRMSQARMRILLASAIYFVAFLAVIAGVFAITVLSY